MNVTAKAKSLIIVHSKVWLCDKLGISRVALDSKLKFENWKKLEIEKIMKL
jgi:hypothetical protein